MLNGNYAMTNRKLLSMDFAVEVFSKQLEIGLLQHEALYCYGMSKQTIARENEA